MKHFTILFEIRSGYFPKRLKIEIRKEIRNWDFQEKIAYSKFSTKQVVLKAHTLEQTMKNKIAALLERVEMRDGFDIEFLLRQGIPLPDLSDAHKTKMIARLDGFKENDFKVKLGSILESDIRAYYIENQFNYLRQKLRHLKHSFINGFHVKLFGSFPLRAVCTTLRPVSPTGWKRSRKPMSCS